MRSLRPKPSTLVMLFLVFTAGCANQNSIFRMNTVRGDRPVVFTVDAKQRHLLIAPSTPGKAADGWKVCAEAAPDVFSALSTSAAADIGFGQGGAKTEARAKAAIAIAEAAGTIERTQTINMLRESMYRTCERYLSGGIDKPTFVVQAGRDWRAMIAILAIEQLTRAARSPSTIIAAGSTSATVQGTSEAVRQLIIAQGEEDAARNDKKKADGELAAANCGTITDENKDNCAAKKAAADDAAEALTRATQRRETWEQVTKSSSQVEGSLASTGVGPSNPGGGQSESADASNIATVASVVRDIVHEAFQTDETQLFCVQALYESSTPYNITSRCIQYLMDKVESDRRSLFNRPDVITSSRDISLEIQTSRMRMVQFLQSLSPPEFPLEREAISKRLGSFCNGMTRKECIAAINSGEIDASADAVPSLLEERIQARIRK